MIDVTTEAVTLFYPEPNLIYQIFMHIMTKEDVEKKYSMPAIPTKDMEAVITKLAPVPLSL